MALAAVTDYSAKVVDYTAEDSGGGGNNVSTSFTIAGTSPIRINGAASADLSTSPDTISVLTFGAAQAGVVPLSGGGTTNFLRADGTWASPVGSGGYTTIQEEGVDLTQRGKLDFSGADITATDDSANSRTKVTITRFTSIAGGTVPASGGSASQFLCADGTWKSTTAVGGGVTLQGATPGTADIGHAHITGTFIADSAVIAGSTKPSLNGLGHEQLYVKQSTASNLPVVATYASSNPTAGFVFRGTRGTEAVPAQTHDGDELVALNVSPYLIASANYDQREFLVVAHHGTVVNHVPYDVTIYAGAAVSGDTGGILKIGANGNSGIGPALDAVPPLSGFEVATSFGLKRKLLSNADSPYTIVEATDPPYFIVDCTAGDVIINLSPAGTRAGRIYGFTKVDATANSVILEPLGGEDINGLTVFKLNSLSDSVDIASDGTNWWSKTRLLKYNRSVTHAEVPVVNTAAETTVFTNTSTDIWESSAFPYSNRIVCAGKFSTTGTPTLRFKVKNGSAVVLADSGAVTMPNTVTAAAFEMEFEAASTSLGTRTMKATLRVGQTAGFGGEMKTYNMHDVTLGIPAGAGVGALITAQWGAADPANTVTMKQVQWSWSPRLVEI